jgi:hypothetical protein
MSVSGARATRAWLTLLLALLAIRLPSLVQPAGGDQGLYVYAGQRLAAGDVMYRDVWDQKPPAIAVIYALVSRLSARDAIVPAADLGAAALTAWLLVVIGRRKYTGAVGFGAAALFLLFGDPYLQRLSGIYVRGQCEPFIYLAVTAAVALLADRRRTRRHLIGAGLALALAFWLKYNAVAYALPLLAALWAWNADAVRPVRSALRQGLWIAAGFVAVAVAVIAWFASQGALQDLRLATIDYNLQYSNETYEGATSMARYVATFPLSRARVDMLWFLGGIGALLLALRRLTDRSTAVTFSWLAAAAISIAINGSRGLPNYFVQAAPVLALAAAAGLSTLRAAPQALRFGVAALLVAGLWRVGSDAPVLGMRLASLPGLAANVGYDLAYLRGRLDRDTYLQRFKGQKHDAIENDQLVRYVKETTAADDRVFVFGFSGGSVGWKSSRASSSRFFWSRPVTTEFAAGREGYGSAGLLRDLRTHPPVLVALQKEEWRSRDFFMNHEGLRRWLEDGYAPERETAMFSVWRRKR